jgi:hypothetical protein
MTKTKQKPTPAASGQNRQWFDIDRAGLAKVLRRKGVEFALYELMQNAWDEDGVTKVDVQFTYDRGDAHLVVADDAPEGFRDLSDAYTLFAESYKKTDPLKRGRFNVGEKLVLALCDRAAVVTTTGTVTFGVDGRQQATEPRTESGSVFECNMPLTRKEFDAACAAVSMLIPPSHIESVFNGAVLASRTPVTTIQAQLPTELADSEGALRKAWRTTTVTCYEVGKDEIAHVYEMGIPIVEHECRWHCDVAQKVPLTLDRENVPPNFLRALRVALFNKAHDLMTADDMNREWAASAIEHPDADPEAVRDYMTKRFGEQRVSYDPSDREANRRAVSEGYTVVHSGHLSKAAWDNVREADAIKPAGKVTPSAKVWTGEGAGAEVGAAPIPVDKWTDGMKAVAEYAKVFALQTIRCPITVKFFSSEKMLAAAAYGGRELSFNKFRLGNRFFDLQNNRVAVDDIIIHELAHEMSGDHLSDAYYHALTRVGALAMSAVRKGVLP